MRGLKRNPNVLPTSPEHSSGRAIRPAYEGIETYRSNGPMLTGVPVSRAIRPAYEGIET